MCGIQGEDEYQERRREEWENPRTFRSCSARDQDEPVYATGNLFLEEEIEEIEKARGYPMKELYEGDLLEIVEEQKGIVADSEEWNDNWDCIEYRYRVAQEEEMQNIVEFIKKEMADRGMTYDLLAEKVGTSRQNLWLKLNKNSRPNFETVRKILAALDYDLVFEKKKDSADRMSFLCLPFPS